MPQMWLQQHRSAKLPCASYPPSTGPNKHPSKVLGPCPGDGGVVWGSDLQTARGNLDLQAACGLSKGSGWHWGGIGSCKIE